MKQIYVLLDPRDHYTAYIGCSQSAVRRYYEHLRLKDDTRDTSRWITELGYLGKQPLLRVIMEVSDEDAASWEDYWIHDYRRRNFRVLNRYGRQVRRLSTNVDKLSTLSLECG